MTVKLPFSAYLSGAKPALKRLLAELGKDFPYASVLGQDSVAMRYSVSRAGMNVSEQDWLTKRGFVLRVHNGRGFGEYAFNEIDEDSVVAVANAAREALSGICGDDPLPGDEPCVLAESNEYAVDPEALGGEEILGRLARLREDGLKKSDKLLDMSAGFVWQKAHKLFLSKNRDLCQSILWSNGTLFAMAARGEEIKDYYKGFSGLCGAELMDDMAAHVEATALCAVELLKSEPMQPGEYDCICDPDTTGMIVHEAFGHGVEMDMFVKKRAQAVAFMGKRVASDLVNMRDGAKAAVQCASFAFDDEGTLAQDTLVIENGILKSGYADALSAARLSVAPTGNGRRESFERKAYTRMTNTFFTPGTDTLEDMIASVKHGFLLENPSSGMEDPKNWGIQCMVNIAREIKDGKLTGKLFSPIVLTGYVPDLLKSISMMSGELTLGGGGYCGKGYKEWVKVSDGGPYIKARIRLG